jgi:hypothetical protein
MALPFELIETIVEYTDIKTCVSLFRVVHVSNRVFHVLLRHELDVMSRQMWSTEKIQSLEVFHLVLRMYVNNKVYIERQDLNKHGALWCHFLDTFVDWFESVNNKQKPTLILRDLYSHYPCLSPRYVHSPTFTPLNRLAYI